MKKIICVPFLICFSLILLISNAEAANRYWIATSTANWNSTANWSTTSGGSSGASVPGSGDIAIFNNLKVGNCTVNATVNVAGISIVSGYTGTISQGSNNITVGSSNYSQAAGTFTGGSGAIDINGTFSLSGGTFTANTANFNLGGTFAANTTLFSHTGGTFNNNNGTLILDPVGSFTYTLRPTSTTAFNNVTINAAGTTNMFAGTDTLRVNNALSIQAITFNTGVISVKGNTTVTGLVNGTGVIAFTGTHDQNFNLTGHTNKFNVTANVNLSPGKKLILQSELVLDQTFTAFSFTRGIVVTTATNFLTVHPGIFIGTGSNASYVDGPIKKVGNVAYTFPVGKNGYYRKISISAPAVATDAYTAEYFDGNSNLVHPHTSKDGSIAQLSRNEYWTLTRNTGTSNVSVTLSWDVPPSCSFSNVANTKVCVWDGSNWKDKGNGGTTGTTTSGTVVSSAVLSTFGKYALGTSSTFTCYDNVSALTLDSLVKYVMLSGDTVQTAPPINVNGRVGAVKLILGTIYASGGKYGSNSGNVPNAMTTLGNLITNINGRHGLALSSLNGISIGKGVYRSIGNSELDGKITLTGTSSDTYIFKVSGDLTIRSHSQIALGNVLPNQVYWLASGNIYIEDSVEVSGIFISQQNLDVLNDNQGAFSLWASGDITISGDTGSTNSFYSPNDLIILRGGTNYASALKDCDWIATGGSSSNDGITGGYYMGQDICTDGTGKTFVGFTCNGQSCTLNDFNSSTSVNNGSASDAILTCYYSNGDIHWFKNANPGDGSSVNCGAVTYEKVGATEYVYMAGTFNGQADFGSGSPYYSSNGAFYIAIYNATNGNFVRLIQDGTGTDVIVSDLDVDPSFNIYVCGMGATTINGSPISGPVYIASYTNLDVFRWSHYGTSPKNLYPPGLVYSGGEIMFAGTYHDPASVYGFIYSGGISLDGPNNPTLQNIYYLELASATGNYNSHTPLTGFADQKSLAFSDIYVNYTNGDVYMMGYNNSSFVPSPDPQYPPERSFYLLNGSHAGVIDHTSGVVRYSAIAAYGTQSIYVTGVIPETGNGGVNNILVIDGISYTASVADGILRKLDPSNNYVKTFGGSGIDQGTGLAVDACRVFTLGFYNDQAEFEGEYFDTRGGSDCFVLRTENTPKPVTITPAGAPSICTGQTLLLDAGSGYTTYLWSNGATTQTTTINASGTYSVTVTTGCCTTIFDDIVITETASCCFFPGYPDYDNYIASSQLPNFTGGTFSINHYFTLNTNITFSGCTIKLGKDARIRVPAGKTLTITGGSHLYGCTDMWDGIYVEYGGSIVINGSSIIEDAKDAVYIPDGSAYNITNSYFNKNRVHINIYNDPYTPYPTPNPIIDCEFHCRSNPTSSSSDVLLKPPYASENTFKAITATTPKSITIGQAAHDNGFSNARYGVYCLRVEDDLIVNNNTFNNITDVAIYATKCAVADDLDITNNTINKTVYGVFCFDNPMAEIQIEDNVINLSGMSPNPTYRYGVVVQEVAGGTTSEVSIHENTISSATTGIWTIDLNGLVNLGAGTGSLYIGVNTITHTKASSDGQAGILSQNCLGALIIDNDVRQPIGETVVDWKVGIRQDIGNTNFVTCNTTHDIGTGIYISGDVTPLEYIALNEFQTNKIGIRLLNSKVGNQGYSSNAFDNKWLGGAGYWVGANYTTRTEGTTIGTNNVFWVQSGSPYYPGNNSADVGAFVIDLHNPATAWGGAACPVFTPPSYKTDEDTEDDIETQLTNLINDTPVLQTTMDISLNWMGEYGLYKNLIQHPDLISSEVIDGFYTAKFNGNMGVLERAITDYNVNRALDGTTGEPSSNSEAHLSNLQQLHPENQVEVRLKEVLDIFYTNVIEETSLDEDDVKKLREIADLCPYTDGFGVFMARVALVEVDTFPKVYDDKCTASKYGNKWEGNGSEDEALFNLYPNPNQGSFTLHYILNEMESGMIEVFDVVGNLVYTQSLNANAMTTPVSMNELSDGVYLVAVKVNDTIRFKKKVTLIR